jgi:hypothetical protein
LYAESPGSTFAVAESGDEVQVTEEVPEDGLCDFGRDESLEERDAVFIDRLEVRLLEGLIHLLCMCEWEWQWQWQWKRKWKGEW